ncbi:DUF2459 domain-containing protein [Gymnodinialimonas ulvae]|uniref:DUF2459 domain-containing protein n=1 Tax=Gymnodinialimonas ulvae TaxID=3126504 RepID=UPI0030A622C2
MRRVLRLTGRLVGAALGVLAAYLVAAALGGLVPGPVGEMPEAPEEVEIGLLFGPIHVDFLLPASAETRAALAPVAAAGVPLDDPGVAHLIVGWGAQDFYTTAGTYADITLSAAARAVAGDASVLRVDVLGPIAPGAAYPRLRLSAVQYQALLAEIAATIDGPPLPGVGFTATDGFVVAAGRFHVFRTCNTWVGRSLRAAGVDIGAWTPTPYSLRLSLWRAGLS